MASTRPFAKFLILKRLKRIGCGCLVIFLLLILLGLIFSGVIIRKLISGAITEQTGIVQTNTGNVTGQSYTDPKTGATINLGINKIPDSFPKDFPIYPGSTVVTSQTGQGFWLSLVTNDNVEKVSSYYENSLKINGWTAVQASTTANTGNSWALSKGSLSGYLTVETSNGQTSILVVLGEVKTQ